MLNNVDVASCRTVRFIFSSLVVSRLVLKRQNEFQQLELNVQYHK